MNQLAKGEDNGIYKKQEVYLVRKWKVYRKARSKQDAIQNPEAIKVLQAVNHLPKRSAEGSRINDEFRDSSLRRGDQDMIADADVTPIERNELNDNSVSTVNPNANARERYA